MLTDAKIKNLKPGKTRQRIADFDGLYIEILPTGKKTWLFRYTKEGTRNWTSLGAYPAISLKEARERRDGIKAQILLPATSIPGLSATFSSVLEEWIGKKVDPVLSANYAQDIRERSKNHILPLIGQQKISEISSADVLRVLRRVESAGHVHMAHKVCQICGRVFRYGIASGYCENDPTNGLRGALQSHVSKHQASITNPKEIGGLLRAVQGYSGIVVRCAMIFQAYTFVRPGELRHAEWSEINTEKSEWRIPAEKMKMRRVHIVPLSRQSMEVLEKVHPITGHGRYIFPSGRTPHGDRPMSENAVTAALRNMGYSGDQMTGHGFRSMASTLLNENGFNRDWIERQLAHSEGNSVRAAYNYAEYLPERRKMMQWWADYLDELRQSTE